ncbi:hypothetical protein BDR04DRAFT_1163586 [Suillus decipiens]|nr:hypothetical protein BDR04DRAFT_1163586 [Suillus decipiens]
MTTSTNLDYPGPSNILAVPVTALSDRLEWLKLSDSISALPIKKSDRETTSKLKHSWCTSKALQILANIDSWIQWSFCLLLCPYNLDNIGHELALLCTAIKNVNGGADVVIAQKKAIDVRQVPLEINTDALQQAPVDHSDEISQVILFLCVACRVVMGRLDSSLSSLHKNILKQIPLTSEGAETKFHLSGKTITYTICNCHCTYPPMYVPGSTTARYPKHCMHCPTPETKCGNALLVGTEGEFCPKKVSLYHNFKDYLSGLLPHRDVKAMMDEACNDLMDSINSPLPPFIKNPFEAQFLH